MILADVNVLLHAFRCDTKDHAVSRTWLDRVVNGESHYGVSPQVLSSVVRIATHPKVFAQPSELGEVIAFCDVLLRQTHCVVVQPGRRHWSVFSRLCQESDARGNLVPDAWFAALAIESSSDWITFDRNYARLTGLKWRLPS